MSMPILGQSFFSIFLFQFLVRNPRAHTRVTQNLWKHDGLWLTVSLLSKVDCFYCSPTTLRPYSWNIMLHRLRLLHEADQPNTWYMTPLAPEMATQDRFMIQCCLVLAPHKYPARHDVGPTLDQVAFRKSIGFGSKGVAHFKNIKVKEWKKIPRLGPSIQLKQWAMRHAKCAQVDECCRHTWSAKFGQHLRHFGVKCLRLRFSRFKFRSTDSTALNGADSSRHCDVVLQCVAFLKFIV